MAATRKLTLEILLKDKVSTVIKTIIGHMENRWPKAMKRAQTALKLIMATLRTFGTRLNQVMGIIKKVMRTLTSLPALIGAAAAAFAGFRLATSFLDAAREAENLRVRLRVLLGDVALGNKLFKDMSNFASQVAFEYREIMQSATALAAVVKGGVDEVNQWMPLLADLAAATGLTLEETTSQFIRMYSAGAASADLFRERGVLAMLGFRAGVSYTARQTREQLIKAWEEPTSRFRGAAAELANTWDGMMSMLSDAWFQFRNAVMEAGLFNFLKAGLKNILDLIKRLRDEGKLQEWAESISNAVINAMKTAILWIGKLGDAVVNAVGIIIGIFTDLYTSIRYLMDFLPGVRDKLHQAINAEEMKKGYDAWIAKIGELEERWTKFTKGAISESDLLAGTQAKNAEEFRKGLDAQIAKTERYRKVRDDFIKQETKYTTEEEHVQARRILQIREYSDELADSTRLTELATEAVRVLTKTTEDLTKAEEQNVQAKREPRRGVIRARGTPAPAVEGPQIPELPIPQMKELTKATLEAKEAQIQLSASLHQTDQAYERGEIAIEQYYLLRQEAIRTAAKAELAVVEVKERELARAERDRKEETYDALLKLTHDYNSGELKMTEEAFLKKAAQLAIDYEHNVEHTQKLQELGIERSKIEEKVTQDLDKEISKREAALQRLADAQRKANLDLAQMRVETGRPTGGEFGMGETGGIFDQLTAQEQLLDEQHLARKEEFRQKVLDGVITEAQEEEAIQLSLAEKEKAILEARTQAHVSFANAVGDTLGGLGSAFDDLYEATGKKMKEFFYIAKALHIAETIMSTYAAAQAAYQRGLEMAGTGTAGVVVGAAMAAVAVAQGLARVAIISAQTFNAAKGGKVPGTYDGRESDSVDARLTPGEYVQPLDTVRHYGVGVMEAIRRRLVPRELLAGFQGLPPLKPAGGFATGGSVAAMGGKREDRREQPMEVNIANFSDPKNFDAWASSRAGQNVLLNVMSDRAPMFRNVLFKEI